MFIDGSRNVDPEARRGVNWLERMGALWSEQGDGDSVCMEGA
jgi:hypothetical protein